MKKGWVVAIAAVPVVVIAAVAGVALSFDPNGQKDRIVEAVRRATGRDLTLAGPVRLGWSLTPTLEAEDVSFANMPSGSRPAMATAGRVEFQVKLLPLLSHRVELAQVTLVRPDILIETDANGRGNWQFERAAPAPSATQSPSTPGTRTQTILDRLVVDAGRVTWHDGVTGRTIVADLPSATLQGGDGPVHLVAQAQSSGTAVTLDATLGTIPQLTGAVAGPWPVKLVAAIGNATLAVTGTADPVARTLSGRVEGAVPDLAQLGGLLQRQDWPALHDIQFAATLPAAGGLPQDVSLHLGASDLGRYMPGATLGHLSLTWPAGQPARLDADGSMAGAPWKIGSGLVPAGTTGAGLRGLSVSSAFGDAAGDLAVLSAPRPALRGTLVSNRLDLDAIRTVFARPAPAAAPAPTAPAPNAPPAALAPARVFSDTPLPWARLNAADADLQLSIATLRLGGAEYHNATGHIVLQNGALRVDPASVQAPEGRVDFSASADANAPAPPVALALRSAAFALDPLMQAFGLPTGSDATAELDVALHATGATPHALAATLDGHVGIALVDGDVSNAALSAALGDIMRMAGARLDTNGRSHVRCLAIQADARAGQISLPALKLDTSRLLLEGGGTVNLSDETMALRLRPLLRLGGAGVSAPVRLDGSIRHPTAALDAANGTGRVGVVIGGLAGSAENCTAELTAARDGRAGPLPAEAAAGKPPKPADLLRSLLR
ncbi:AsmA family protein [Acidisphaera sp. L21]|uniref:AsmA family protein n=1 Tax=Acidisphaera sp. L21 TaxID=1641851 RepID=UPI00131B3032|nr:AsmA family protein [Acidisphaera sp. L21]